MNRIAVVSVAALLTLQGCALVPSGAPPSAAPGGQVSAMRESLRDYVKDES